MSINGYLLVICKGFLIKNEFELFKSFGVIVKIVKCMKINVFQIFLNMLLWAQKFAQPSYLKQQRVTCLSKFSGDYSSSLPPPPQIQAPDSCLDVILQF